MRAAKWVLSSDSTRTSAPGRPARMSCATCSGFMVRVYREAGSYFVSGLSGRAGAYNRQAMQSPVSIAMTPPTDDAPLLASARKALAIEAAAVAALAPRLDKDFATACRICLACEARVVVTGMGKSGHIARKIAAT